jgi:carbonic anhydrase
MVFRIIIALMTLFVVACGSKKKAQDSAPEANVPAAAPSPMANPDADPVVPSMAQPSASASSDQVHITDVTQVWSYEGATGPDKWSELKPEYLLCKTGKNQSPINLKWNKPQTGGDISFQYRPEPLKVTDTGYSYEVELSGTSSATLHGKSYALNKIQFRTSSEHALSGNLLPMEAQLFHKAADGEQAIVSIIVIQGHKNPVFQDVLDNMPKQKGVVGEKSDVLFDASKILPDRFTHYHYSGSLTTPPCTEGVQWFVLNTPVEVSKGQILQFRSAYSRNNRPLQPLNGRKVVNY